MANANTNTNASTLAENHVISLKVLGFLYLRLGAFERASRLFQALAHLRPDDIEVAGSLAAAELESGHPERALTLLAAPPLAALASDPARNPVTLLLQARAHWRLQQSEAAFAAMDTYLAATRQKSEHA